MSAAVARKDRPPFQSCGHGRTPCALQWVCREMPRQPQKSRRGRMWPWRTAVPPAPGERRRCPVFRRYMGIHQHQAIVGGGFDNEFRQELAYKDLSASPPGCLPVSPPPGESPGPAADGSGCETPRRHPPIQVRSRSPACAPCSVFSPRGEPDISRVDAEKYSRNVRVNALPETTAGRPAPPG
jgi:hypothetical protein